MKRMTAIAALLVASVGCEPQAETPERMHYGPLPFSNDFETKQEWSAHCNVVDTINRQNGFKVHRTTISRSTP